MTVAVMGNRTQWFYERICVEWDQQKNPTPSGVEFQQKKE
jgi:hypothetical protein